MILILYAQPYDISATGFYFETAEQFMVKITNAKNDYGETVEEFEIQFIDGELLDAEFAKAFEVNQVNLERFFELVDEWEEHEKIRFIIAVGECGYSFDIENDDIDQLEVDIYEENSLKDLAIRFVEKGLYGEIPERLQYYIDYDAIARDLDFDHAQITIAGNRLIYQCG